MAKRTPFQRAEFRQERLLRDREAIRVLRDHFRGYSAKEGYSLDIRKIEAMPASRRRGLRKKYAKVQKILSHPFVEPVKPKTKAETRALRRFTHQRFRNQRHFLVQKPTAESRVQLVESAAGRAQVELHTQFPGEAEFTERYYLFPRRPRDADDLLAMLEEMLPDMPDTGRYVMLTDTYGDIDVISDKGQLRNVLRQFLGRYDDPKYEENRFLYRPTGFRWIKTAHKGVEVRHERLEARDRVRAMQREEREELEAEARERARRQCPVVYRGRRCVLISGHRGRHKWS